MRVEDKKGKKVAIFREDPTHHFIKEWIVVS